MKQLLLILGFAFSAPNMNSVEVKPCPASAQVVVQPWQGPKLSKAILDSDAGAAAKIIDEGVDLNERDNQDNTPLIIALTPRASLEPSGVVSGKTRELAIRRETSTRIQIVSLLLSKGADPNASGAQGRTALMQIAKWGRGPDWSLRTAKELLSQGARVDSQDAFGNTALILASAEGKARIVQLLLDHGADPKEKNCHNESAISIARANTFMEVVRLLEPSAKR